MVEILDWDEGKCFFKSVEIVEIPWLGGPVVRTWHFSLQGSSGKLDRKSTRLNSSHSGQSRMPSSA